MISCMFYDLFKDIQVIHYILGFGNEPRNNKTLKTCSIAMSDGKSESYICM